MSNDLSCENCGKTFSLEPNEGQTPACPFCQAKLTVQPETASVKTRKKLTFLSHVGMPFIISLALHVCLALIMMFIAMVVISNTAPEDLIIPDAVLADEPGGKMTLSQHDPLRKASYSQTQKRTYKKDVSTIEKEDTGKKAQLIGLDSAAASGSVNFGFAAETGDAPSAKLFGLGGNAYHVVYVIDRSGSMTTTFNLVRQELLISISKLKPVQDFHVILFSTGEPLENSPLKLVSATKRNKAGVAEFLTDIRGAGGTDPVPALKRAFEVLARAGTKPGKLIYLLTDGEFPDNNMVIETVRSLNPKGDVHINTFLYGHRPANAVAVMKQIAAENGGRYKYVSGE